MRTFLTSLHNPQIAAVAAALTLIATVGLLIGNA